MRWSEYYADPFEYVNNLSVKVAGVELNLLKNHSGVRRTLIIYALFCTGLWVVMGFDSGMGQFEFPISKWIVGEAHTWKDLVYWYDYAYGKTMHWSAFTIYGLLWVGISLALENNLGITRTKNCVYSFCFMLFNIAVFEYFWIYGFAFYQNQWWVAKWAWPQIRILIQNLGFTIVGLMGLLYFWVDSHRYDENGDSIGRLYHFKPDLKLVLVLLLTLGSAVFWINYPWHVDHVQVDIEGIGFWENTDRFPQTLYTVDMDVTDGVNAGDWFYVENDTIHLVNTVMKSLLALSSYVFIGGWRKI